MLRILIKACVNVMVYVKSIYLNKRYFRIRSTIWHTGKAGLWTHGLDTWNLDVWTLALWRLWLWALGHLHSEWLGSGHLNDWTWMLGLRTFGLWAPGRLDSGQMDACILDAWTLDPWTQKILPISSDSSFFLITIYWRMFQYFECSMTKCGMALLKLLWIVVTIRTCYN